MYGLGAFGKIMAFLTLCFIVGWVAPVMCNKPQEKRFVEFRRRTAQYVVGDHILRELYPDGDYRVSCQDPGITRIYTCTVVHGATPPFMVRCDDGVCELLAPR